MGEFSFVSVGPIPPTGTITAGKDRRINPVTKDYIRTANGEWQEDRTSETALLIALSIELGASIFDPDQGTAIPKALRDGTLTEVDFLQSETVRVGGDLQKAGLIADLVVTVRDRNRRPLVDEAGRATVHTVWRDLAAGSPITATFTPR